MIPHYQFFSLPSDAASQTLFVSLCTNDNSGCMYTGDRLRAAKFPEADHMRIAFSKYKPTQVHYDKTRDDRAYRYLVITGCKFSEYAEVIWHITQKLSLHPAVSASVILPVHLMPSNFSNFQKFIVSKLQPYVVNTEVFACDLESIGFPSMLAFQGEKEEKVILHPEFQCYSGLLYLPKMGSLYPAKADEAWLHAYCKFLSESSALRPIKCLAINSHAQKREISKAAALYQIQIEFCEKLDPLVFEKILIQIRKNNGVVGINGVVSFIQAASLGCQVMHCQAFEVNRNFYGRLSKYFPANNADKIDKAAAVVLGQSKNFDELSDTRLLARIFSELTLIFQKASQKFASAIPPTQQAPGIPKAFSFHMSKRALEMVRLAQEVEKHPKSEGVVARSQQLTPQF